MPITCPQLSQDPPHDHQHAERATLLVLLLTLVTMAAEIAVGWWTGSMALLADGWHMGMHAAAMGVALFAYRFARRHRGSGLYAFGAGKAADLGAFANAILLAVVAVLIGAESVERLVTPGPIAFGPALMVAGIGLAVNLLSAWLLREQPHEHAGHDHPHGAAQDHNRQAALIHVLSDALTSALAIVALFCAQRYGLVWMDPLTGLVGAVVILRWAVGLVRRSGGVLLDATPQSGIAERIQAIVAAHGDELVDLHVWPIAAGRFAASVIVRSTGPATYRDEIHALAGIAHLTLECSDGPAPSDPPAAHRHHHHHAC